MDNAVGSQLPGVAQPLYFASERALSWAAFGGKADGFRLGHRLPALARSWLDTRAPPTTHSVAKFRTFATELAPISNNGLAGAQISRASNPPEDLQWQADAHDHGRHRRIRARSDPGAGEVRSRRSQGPRQEAG